MHRVGCWKDRGDQLASYPRSHLCSGGELRAGHSAQMMDTGKTFLQNRKESSNNPYKCGKTSFPKLGLGF